MGFIIAMTLCAIGTLIVAIHTIYQNRKKAIVNKGHRVIVDGIDRGTVKKVKRNTLTLK